MEYIEVSAKTLSDAITEACQKLEVTSHELEYEVIDEGSNGFLGIGSKPAVIKARVKEEEKKVTEKKGKDKKKLFEPIEEVDESNKKNLSNIPL